MADDLQFATVEIHPTPWEAQVSRGMLESEGIPVCLAGEHHVGAMRPMSHALGGVRINVPVKHLAQAHAVLAQRNNSEFEAALLEQVPFKRAACQACGSTALRDERPGLAVLLAMCSFFAGNAIFPPPKDSGARRVAAMRRPRRSNPPAGLRRRISTPSSKASTPAVVPRLAHPRGS